LKTIEGGYPLFTFKELLQWFKKYIDTTQSNDHKLQLDIKRFNPTKITKFIVQDLLTVHDDISWWYHRIQFGIWDLNFLKYLNQSDYFQDKDKNENDIFIAGDFNLYALDESFRPLYKHADKITYAIDPAIKTTIGTKGRANSYDNFFFSQKYSQEFTGSSGALDFSGDNPKLMREIISDHIPVFIVVETSKDDD